MFLSKRIKEFNIIIGILLVIIILYHKPVLANDGKALFKQSCGVCHTTTEQKLVGPGLKGITEKRQADWLLKWIKDSQALIASGDADAKKVFEEGGKSVMPPFTHLKDDEIQAIIDFLAAPPEVAPAIAVNNENKNVQATETGWVFSTGQKYFIGTFVILFIGIILYIMILKRKMRALGYGFDSIPLKDQISTYVEQNGKFLLVIGIIVILTTMKSCISALIP